MTSGCNKGHAADVRPDLSGMWDVTYDDYLDVEVRVGESSRRARLAREGGEVSLADAGALSRLEIDCARAELICPNEVWPRELELTNRIGDLDDDGTRITMSLVGEGLGVCTLSRGSQALADVESTGSARTGNWQATALSRGRISTTFDAACVGLGGAAQPDVQVTLSTGFSAVRR
jgi:hypothetical protein